MLSGQLPDHARGHHVVHRLVLLALEPVARLVAQFGRHLQRLRVSDAGQPDLATAGVHHDLSAVVVPAGAQLRLAVDDGDNLDAFAAGVGQPEGQRDGQIW